MSGVSDAHSRRSFLRVAAVSVAGLVPGCAWKTLFEKPPSLFHQVNKLPPITVPPGAMRLDIVFVERPVGDRLLSDALWQNVDQVAALENSAGDLLRRNGFRAGVVGSDPPQPLQTLLGLKSDFANEATAEKAKHLVGRQITLGPEGETEIQVSPVLDERTVEITDGKLTVARSYEQCRGMFRVIAHRVQDGWARLEFVPVVYHGAESLHHVAASEGWQFANGQKSEAFYEYRFRVTLGVGEMAVISAEDRVAGADSLGHLFFIGNSHLQVDRRLGLRDADVRRALVVRLSDMSLGENPYAPNRRS